MFQSARAVILKVLGKKATFVLGATNAANSTAPRLTIPATAAVGDVFIFMLSQNNTNVLTASPASTTLIDTNTTTATFPTHLYRLVVNGTTFAAGTVLAWTLSTTRAWATAGYLVRGVDTTNPVVGFTPSGGLTSAITIPSITTAVGSFLLELGAGKGNGTSITNWTTGAAGWIVQVIRSSFSGFAGSIFMADNGGAQMPANTYGGEVYTPDQTGAASVGYIVALRPA